MSKKDGDNVAVFASPLASNDFYKTNGMVHLPVMPGGASLTRQEFAAECDINSIMQRYEGHLANPMQSVREPMYYDFTEMPDTLMGLMDQLKVAEEAFMSLPALVRREFENDPVAFADFASNPLNLEQMREWGLAPPAKVPDAVKEPVPANDAKPAPAPQAAPAAAHTSST